MTTYEQAPDARGRFAELDPLGVIDIGSNSVRLVVYEGAVRAPDAALQREGAVRPGALGGDDRPPRPRGGGAGAGGAAALSRHRRDPGVKSLRAVATAACREAEDGADFITRGEEACGTHIEVLSGEEEAELAAQGIMMGFMHADGFAADLGGGSLELIDIARQSLAEATTMPLGGLRLIDTTGSRSTRR